MTDVAIRALGAADVPAAVALLAEVGLGGAAGNLARYLAWQPACGWVAVRSADDALVGSVTVLRQGEVGFVGCMAVAPALQGSGLGRRLLEHAHAAGRRAGVVTFLLEATRAGEVLYARLGYVTTGETVIAARAATGGTAARGVLDADAICALDRTASGLDRRDMIRGLLAEGGAGTHLTDRGYGLVVGERLGPVVARDAGAGRAIVDAVIAPCTVVTAPVHAGALAALAAHGFAVVRPLRRMCLGLPPAAPREQIWALASPGAG